jgi:hypothetical protein
MLVPFSEGFIDDCSVIPEQMKFENYFAFQSSTGLCSVIFFGQRPVIVPYCDERRKGYT